jgi:hypothetical protein
MSALCPQPTKKIRKKLGPYSRVLERGVIGRSIDGRSTEGRFLRDFEARLVAHLGGSPAISQLLLIRRLARVALRLELFDEKLDASGGLTDIDGRVYGALHNSYIRLIAALGIQPAPARPLSPSEQLAVLTAAARRGREALDDGDE